MGVLLLELLIAVGVIVGVILGAGALARWVSGLVRQHNKRARAQADDEAYWEVHTRAEGTDLMVVEVIRPGETLEVAQLDPDKEDFEEQLQLAKSRARAIVLSLNSN